MLFSQCSELICCFDLISASAGTPPKVRSHFGVSVGSGRPENKIFRKHTFENVARRTIIFYRPATAKRESVSFHLIRAAAQPSALFLA